MSKKIAAITAAVAVVALLTSAACGGIKNSPESENSAGPTCEQPGSVPAPNYNPYDNTRPPDVRPGNSWVAFELTVVAIGAGGDYNHCVPIAVHVYARSLEADAVALDSHGFEAGPVDFIVTTPWRGRFVALQYDPTEERFAGRPPDYKIHLDSRYLPERDLLNQADPIALQCSIRNGNREVVKNDPAIRGSGFVTCSLTGNDYWRPY